MVGIASFVHAKKGIWAIQVFCKVMKSFYQSSTHFAGNTKGMSDMTRCCPDHLEGALHLVQNPAPFQLEEVPWSRNSVMVNWLGFWQLYPLNKIGTVYRVYTFVVANVALLCSFYFPDSRQERTAFTHFPEQRLQEQSIAWTVPVRVAICLLIPRGACGRRKPT